MIVFHSSPCIVNHLDVSFSRDYLDFGKGFYVTTIEDQARKYARRFLLRGKNAYLNKYELTDDLRNYNARYFDSYDDSWLDFVALCRAGRDKSDYDIVTGGIANDKVFRTVDLFFSGEITKDEALRNLLYEMPNVQICLRSQKLLDAELTFISSEEIR